jgi:hypothetical protein
MKASVLFVKEVRGVRTVGRRDEDGNLIAECDCGHSLFGHQDYWAMRTWVSQHASRHLLTIAPKP